MECYGFKNEGRPRNYFPLPNAVFYLGLSAGALAVYAYLLFCEDRKTHKCYPSYKTIGRAVGMSANTVRKYALRHTFGSSLVNGIRKPDGTLMALSPRQVADLLGHSTSQITEIYYVKKDTTRLQGITDGFNF